VGRWGGGWLNVGKKIDNKKYDNDFIKCLHFKKIYRIKLNLDVNKVTSDKN